MQLKVIKADGSVEEYLHTKVIGTFCNALSMINQPNILAAEQFAEAITFHLYHKDSSVVTSDAIHLMVQAVLTDTGYENASSALNDFHLNRKLQRKRIEVIAEDEFAEPEVKQWDKSFIVKGLLEDEKLDIHLCRAIGSSVEQKVLNIGMTQIRKSLIKQLVLADTAVMMRAQEQLHAIIG